MTPVDIKRESAALEALTVAQLQSRYAEVFGQLTRGRHRLSLIRRILWRLQALDQGDLSDRARRRAAALARDADLRLFPPQHAPRPAPLAAADPRLPSPGTVLTRLYKGRLVEVTVLADGFAYDGERFATLSGVAKQVTGSHWNGFHFFGLTEKGEPKA